MERSPNADKQIDEDVRPLLLDQVQLEGDPNGLAAAVQKLNTLEPDSEIRRRQSKNVFKDGMWKIDPQAVEESGLFEEKSQRSTDDNVQRWRAMHRSLDD